jgi:hypothetical protein
MYFRLIAALLFFVVPGLSYLSADVYRWTDAQGNVFYGNQPPTGARDAKVVFKEQTSPAVASPAAQEESRSTEAVIQELEDELRREQDARQDADSVKKNAAPNQAELVARERVKLEKKLEELENTPLDQFGSQRNKRALIGYYQYRLETLMANPDEYFKTPEPFEGNIKPPAKPQ